jgi:hypothetical protein
MEEKKGEIFPREVDYSQYAISLNEAEAISFYGISLDDLQTLIRRGYFATKEDLGETLLVLPPADLKNYWEGLTDDELKGALFSALCRIETPPSSRNAHRTTDRLVLYGRVSEWPIIFTFKKRKILRLLERVMEGTLKDQLSTEAARRIDQEVAKLVGNIRPEDLEML